ncbi:MAG: hypothetical protein KY450_08025 [Actinobacteria bacterium]|nr:hypothetical protein [Actinomycetota bacterium]
MATEGTMTLPELYLEGLTQRALRGPESLNLYKLGLIEAILKDSLRADAEEGAAAMQAAVRTALEVARWEMRP